MIDVQLQYIENLYQQVQILRKNYFPNLLQRTINLARLEAPNIEIINLKELLIIVQ